MRRYLLPGLVTATAVALLALLTFGVADQGTSSSIDSQVAHGRYPVAPHLTSALPVLGAGGTMSLGELKGKVVVLNIFASWCDPCQAEAPVLEQEQKTLAGHNATVLGVTYLDNSSDSERFVRDNHLTYPVMRDVSGTFVRAFGTNAVPETFIINRNGRIQALRRFQLNARWLRETMPRILAENS
jgi:cytochrome c biogenesis protein CcmG, thiol:disulfide interchange protein DsbE